MIDSAMYVKPENIPPHLVESQLRCARPLLIATLDEHLKKQYEFSIGPTCFVVSFESVLYAVTAAHCVDNVEPEQVLLLAADDYQSINFISKHGILRENIDDHMYTDLALLRIDPDKLTKKQKAGIVPFLVNRRTVVTGEVSPDTTFAFRGYPLSLNEIQYENCTIKRQAIVASGYSDRTIIHAGSGCSAFRLYKTKGLDAITSLNGISGSPVVSIVRRSASYEVKLAGIVFRGELEAGIVHYISSDVLVGFLKRVRNTYGIRGREPMNAALDSALEPGIR